MTELNNSKKDINLLLNWGLVYFSLLVSVVGMALSKTVADRFEGASIHRFTDPIFILGYVLFIIRGFTWLLALRTIPLSKAYPVLSIAFPIILLVSVVIFNEPLTASKVIGSILIIVGITLVSK